LEIGTRRRRKKKKKNIRGEMQRADGEESEEEINREEASFVLSFPWGFLLFSQPKKENNLFSRVRSGPPASLARRVVVLVFYRKTGPIIFRVCF
jgi:hypothetical protein